MHLRMAPGWKVCVAFSSAMICGTLFLKSLEPTAEYMSGSYEDIRAACTPGGVASRAAEVISNYSRDHPVFLQISDYFWVKNESKLSLPYGTNGTEEQIMRTLALINHFRFPEEIERLQCRRCVVVGSGYRLKNSSLGEIINRYDVVIRLNNAPVHKYQKDVGSKTTLRLFYPESAHFDVNLDANPDTLMVLVPFKSMDLQWLKTIVNDEKRLKKGFWRRPPQIWNVNPKNIRILNPYYMEVAATKLLGYNHKTKKMVAKPTTGLMAISFAVHFCDLVHIAGFGYPLPSNVTVPIHYYDKATMKLMNKSGHRVPLEALAIKKLLEHNVIQNLTYF